MKLSRSLPTLSQIRVQLYRQLANAIESGHAATDATSRAYWRAREVQLSRVLDRANA